MISKRLMKVMKPLANNDSLTNNSSRFNQKKIHHLESNHEIIKGELGVNNLQIDIARPKTQNLNLSIMEIMNNRSSLDCNLNLVQHRAFHKRNYRGLNKTNDSTARRYAHNATPVIGGTRSRSTSSSFSEDKNITVNKKFVSKKSVQKMTVV